MKTFETLARKLLRNNYSVLGSGHYSLVLQSKIKENVAIKLGKSTKDPFLSYITKMSFLQTNPYFPIIHNLYVDYENNFYVARMEKLEEGNFSNRLKLSKLFDKESFPETEDSNLNSIVRHIKEFALFYDVEVDVHSNNIMQRGNQLVITDPFSEYEISHYYGVNDWLETYYENLYEGDDDYE